MRTSVDGLMAGHPETPLPGEVVALLGADVVDHSGAGACRVISADLATWLNQTPWATGAAAGGDHVDIYLSSRSRPVDRARFERALDAATVLWFLAYDLPPMAKGVAAPDVAERLTAAAFAAADRLERG